MKLILFHHSCFQLRALLSQQALTGVSCTRYEQREEIYTSEPTPAPTNEPTGNPTQRSDQFNDLYIPIEVVSLSSAQELIPKARDSASFQIKLSCDTDAPTQSPSMAPTISVEPRNETEI